MYKMWKECAYSEGKQFHHIYLPTEHYLSQKKNKKKQKNKNKQTNKQTNKKYKKKNKKTKEHNKKKSEWTNERTKQCQLWWSTIPPIPTKQTTTSPPQTYDHKKTTACAFWTSSIMDCSCKVVYIYTQNIYSEWNTIKDLWRGTSGHPTYMVFPQALGHKLCFSVFYVMSCLVT